MELERLFLNVPSLLGTATKDGLFVHLSPHWSNVLGYPLEELEGTPWLDFVHPDDVEATVSIGKNSVAGRSILNFTNRYRKSNGEYIWLDWASSVGDDDIIYFVATDITERVESQIRLQSMITRLELMATIARVGSWEVSLDDMIPRWDDVTCAIHEVEPGYVPSMEEAVNFYAPEARDKISNAVNNAVETGDVWEVEAPLITAKGNRIWVMAKGKVVRIDGKPVRLVGSFHDITEAKERSLALEDALKQAETAKAEAETAKMAAEAASRAKSRFVANMSHEIRTPLNGILGMTRIIKRTELDEKQQGYAKMLEDCGTAMQSLIEDILDMSRIEAGQIQLEHQAFDLHALLDGTISVVAPQASRKGLQLIADLPDSLPADRLGDEKRLRQVVLNLLGNAVKFTEKGTVTLRVSEPQPGRIRISVADTGPGLDRDLQDAIFDRFAQADTSAERRHDGAGLGLSISRELVGLAGGDIGVSSQPGQGADFWFEWPLPLAEPELRLSPVSGRPEVYAAAGATVLVAEDKTVNFMVIREVLEQGGFEVLHARNGREAIELYKEHDPAVLLLDLHMPEMSGEEAIRQIRKIECRDTPIFAVTADATAETRQRVDALGISGFFVKPFDPDALVAATGAAALQAERI
ncbi:ATP-binding protein [Maricaulis sp.]|uniref:ATP-binding protein n=1 Tax=Maricaulis sp. TaxID=1486257 RepID=UPI0026073BBC|nr:ATP-binding protein [Maricaulis sp.]